MPLPLLIPAGIALAGLVGFGTGFVVSDGAKALFRTTALAGGLFVAVKFGPDIVKAVGKALK